MSKTQFFGSELLSLAPRDWNCRGFRGSDQLHRTCAHFDIAGSQLGVSHFCRAEGDVPLDNHDALLPKSSRFLDLCGRGPLRVERYLHDAGSIAQIEKDNSAQIS